jgi:4-hydroxy-3-methylbut-2-en-1-yl diphosphate reductase
VHNRPVVEALKAKGAIFSDEIADIPIGATVIFSAHGVSQSIKQQAKDRKLKIFDATCPLVTKVHMEVTSCSKRGIECMLIGHVGHPEVEGTMGHYDNPLGGIYLVETIADVEKLQLKNPQLCRYVTQTTLSVDDTQEILNVLRRRFPNISGSKKEDICYATQNRQDAVKELAKKSDVLLVVGSETSSNSNRLKELGERLGCRSTHLIDAVEQLQKAWFKPDSVIGITAGASAPESLVQEVVAHLQQWGVKDIEELQGREETIVFALPKEIREMIRK